MTLLQINNLHTYFTAKEELIHVLRGISFSVEAGEVLGIVGESGCGKSALAKTIIRLLPNDNALEPMGEVSFEGRDLLACSEKQMRDVRGKDISIIFQDPLSSLNPTMSIGEQMIEGLLRHYPSMTREHAFEKAVELLEEVEIDTPKLRITQYPHQLSGGMRQRVLIAIATICKPKLLIADEPTTALDTTVQAQILTLLQKLNTTIILISHNLGVVAKLCNRVLVMYAGSIVEDAPTDELFKNPKHPYTMRLLQSIPKLHDRSQLHPIEGMPPDLSKRIEGCSFCPRCPKAREVCRRIPPLTHSVSDKHSVSCHLYQKKREESHDQPIAYHS